MRFSMAALGGPADRLFRGTTAAIELALATP
jgi:hypothetical protein